MAKKVIIGILIVALLAGAVYLIVRNTQPNQFVVLETHGNTSLCYHTETKVMYYRTDAGGISPCYIYDEDLDSMYIGRYPADYE